MELILINENKLKIMMSGSDMSDYSLDIDRLESESAEAREIFWSILDKAKEQTGFSAEKGRVFVQLYPSAKGGCEMYVTKLKAREKRTPEASGSISAGKRKCAYSFDSLDSLLCVCRRLFDIGYSDDSSAWYYSGRYFLTLTEPEENAYIQLSDRTFIREYGKSENYRNTDWLLAESGNCIVRDNAIEILSSL